MISKQFLKSSTVYSLVGALPLAWGFILLPFYTSLLTPEDFAIFALYTGFSALIQILVNFGLDSYLVVHYIEFCHDPHQLRNQVGTTVISLLAIGIAFILLSLGSGSALFRALFHDGSLTFFPYGFMSVLTAIFNSFFKTYTQLLIYQQRLRRFFWANIFNTIITIVLSLVGLYLFPYTLIGPMWGRLLSGLGIFLLALYWFLQEFGFRFQRDLVRGMIRYCYPLLAYFILVWVLNYVDRFIINHYLEKQDVAVFDFAIKCTFLLEFMQMGLANSIYPKVFAIWRLPDAASRSGEVSKYFHVFSALSLLAIPVFVLAIPFFVPFFVSNSTYFSSFDYILVLSLGFAGRAVYHLYLAPFSLFKKTAWLPRPTLFSALFQVVVTILLVQQWGLAGAVWANLLAKAAQAVFLTFWGRRILPGTYNRTKMILLPMLYVATALLMEYSLPLPQWPRHILMAMVLCGLVVLFYWREIGPMARQWIKRPKVGIRLGL
jgi:O-antigen/teichoic acid export membrane protein